MTKKELKALLKHGKITITDNLLVLSHSVDLVLNDSDIDDMDLVDLGDGRYILYERVSGEELRRVIKLEVR